MLYIRYPVYLNSVFDILCLIKSSARVVATSRPTMGSVAFEVIEKENGSVEYPAI